AQTWSEHCKHKTFTSPILYQEGEKKRRIKSLLGETIVKATRELKGTLCLSVFKDNAGIIAFNKEWAVAFKVETHNHPCAVEPYGGAETGVGGVIRDILGAGKGAKPILNTDVFCFAFPDRGWDLPEGVLHPKRVLKSVVAGVRDYGNRMGIPTANGALWFDEGYVYNPLVFCGSVGILPRKGIAKKVMPGDQIVVVGGRTGRDGIHGATFSSDSLDASTPACRQAGMRDAVQIGHAITEKKLLDVLLRARDRDLYRAVTDCGAGGFSSAIGELGESLAATAARGQACGARVHLEKAPLKYEGLKPWEIWLSESQERMVLAVPKSDVQEILALFGSENVEASVVGEFTRTGKLEVFYQQEKVVDLEMKFLHHGLPREEQRAVWNPPNLAPSPLVGEGQGGEVPLRETWYQKLSDWNTCSREWIIRQYDHEVQGATVVKPLQGGLQEGPGDACVIWPIATVLSSPDATIGAGKFEVRSQKSKIRNLKSKIGYRGIAVSNGLNPEYGKRDPAAMAEAAVDEALRNLVCVGADIRWAALLDNFCWGDTKDPAQLGSLVRAALGCYRAAKIFKVPFISGKDSLNNVYRDRQGHRHSIPGTLLISAIGIVPDIRRSTTMELKGAGHPLYFLGITEKQSVPRLGPHARQTMLALSQAIQNGWVLSCHDLSEGGLAVSLSEMAFAGGFGAEADLKAVVTSSGDFSDADILFAESLTRFLVEVAPEREKDFIKVMKGCTVSRLGTTLATPVVRVRGLRGGWLFEESLSDLKMAWQGPFKNILERKGVVTEQQHEKT
ncbi:MAG: phosphoribosylformylglycinamidine synthase, partial [Elusimicrobia bacterium]|nr:phosphoribosylformylglycinamidine synthase [Elusimicrobiota bacterium]